MSPRGGAFLGGVFAAVGPRGGAFAAEVECFVACCATKLEHMCLLRRGACGGEAL
jgi:hypothetical protein